MLTRIPTHLTQASSGGLLHGSSLDGRSLRGCPPGHRPWEESPCGEPDSQEVRKLARELAAEFEREHVVDAFPAQSVMEVVFEARTDSASEVLGLIRSEPLNASAPRVFEAVESKPQRDIQLSTSDLHAAYTSVFSSSAVARRGTLLNFQA